MFILPSTQSFTENIGIGYFFHIINKAVQWSQAITPVLRSLRMGDAPLRISGRGAISPAEDRDKRFRQIDFGADLKRVALHP